MCLFALAAASMGILSAVRAHVGGEGLWSKGQKEAVYSLRRYAVTRNLADFARYRAAIAVPLGDRKARLELEKPDPDLRVAREGLLQGRNDPADIGGMIRLFRYFRNVDAIDRSIAIWAQADDHVQKLTVLAEKLRAEVESDSPVPLRIQVVMTEIEREADILRPLTDSFSSTLGEASRRAEVALVLLLALVTATLTTLVVLSARAALRERERHQRVLHDSEERYRTFFETSIDSVILGRPDGFIETQNPAARFVFGFSEEEQNRSLSELVRGETRDSIRFALTEAARNGHFRGPLPFRRQDGRVFIGDVSASRFTDRAGELRISVIVRDISERIRAEEEILRLNASLEERVLARTAELEAANRDLSVFNRELESFCYSVSHDLRLPLRSMSGFSELLLEDYGEVLDERATGYLRRVQGACRRMGRLIDDLLSLTRYTRQKLQPTPVDLGAVARDILADLHAEHPERRVEVHIAPDLVATAHGDLALIRVLLRNLLTNAWKFTSLEAGARIEFGSTKQGDEVVYFVRDNGCGFDMAFADKLFRVFNRLHAAEEFEGTGIGLATVQRIVLRHGGRVWAESEKGKGATFYFTLARREDVEGAPVVEGA
ncbi:MAG: ATP-binding protein [Candidatus Binatia bacterium]